MSTNRLQTKEQANGDHHVIGDVDISTHFNITNHWQILIVRYMHNSRDGAN
jgi:tRNA A37 N6-isopentenylltransferase MiaA